MDSNSPLAVTLGDPSGCGPQITFDAWSQLRTSRQCFFVIGPPEIYSSFGPVQTITSPLEAQSVFERTLPVLPIPMLGSFPKIGQPDSENAKMTIESIDKAVSLVKDKEVSAIVTNPINKSVLYEIGFTYPGHTEYISKLCAAVHDPVMMLVVDRLRVALATIHVPLMQVANHLSIDGLIRTTRIVRKDLERRFGIRKPRLAFSGLNPHAGEQGSIGDEEQTIINPAAKLLRSEGVDITDAKPADTVFYEALNDTYDAVIAMTHDQGLIPIKLHDFWKGVNCTLGLEIIRTSPDHGTAYEATLQGKLRSDSLIEAIKCAYNMVNQDVRLS